MICINLKKCSAGKVVILFLGVVYSCFAAQVWAQSVPSDLIDLSMTELFNTEIGSSVSEAGVKKKSSDKWNLKYNYRQLNFDGYKDGTKDLSNSEVLWDPAVDTRTDKNFPVFPDIITQEIHAIISTYTYSNTASLNLVVPYVKQSTDHFSSKVGYEAFNITSEGLGDISVTGSFQLAHSSSETWVANVGLSIPTGSIDEEGDTPSSR